MAQARHRRRSRSAYFRKYNAKHGHRGVTGPRRIIAIDGEGYTLKSGAHRYTYLAACDGEGLVRELRGSKGLTAGQVLGFLLALPRGALLVGYALGYDRTKWVETWPDAAVWRLMRPEERLGESGPLPVEWEGFRVNVVSTRTSVRLSGTSQRCTVWDLFKFFQCSFVKALERWGIGTKEERTRIAKEKARRGSFKGIGPRERAYCQLECRLLATLAASLIKAHDEAGLHLPSYYGPGSSAKVWLKETGADLQNAVYPREMAEAVACAYFGGRFECSRIGPVRAKRLYAYDIASAYPAAMAGLPCMRHGTWEHGNIAYRPPGNVALVRFVVDPHKDACIAWGPLPHRLPDGNIVFPTASAGGWCWNDEFHAAHALHPGVRATESWTWWSSCDCPLPFAERIHELYAERLKWGKAARGLVMRLALNAAYGASAQRVGKGRYRCMVRAGLITSACRAQLLKAVALAKDPWNILELATDSVLSLEKLPIEGTGLGGWERKPWSGGVMLMRPGLRFALEKAEDKTAARGIAGRVLHKNRGKVLRCWERAPLESVTLHTPSFFHGAKLSIRRVLASDEDFDERGYEYRRAPEYGRWSDEQKMLSYSPTPKRESVTPDMRLVPWELPRSEAFRSVPYGDVGQSTLADDLDRMRELEEDQPEPGMVRLV